MLVLVFVRRRSLATSGSSCSLQSPRSSLIQERKTLETQLAAVNKTTRTASYEIFIRPPAGAVRTYEVRDNQTIKSLKVRIMQDFGFKVEDQQLTLSSGRVIEGNSTTLKKWGIASLSRLDVAPRGLGGGKRGKQATIGEHDIVEPVPSDPPEVVEALTSVNFQWLFICT